MKVCLASSGGGHLRQLASLKELLSSVDHYFVVEKTAYSQSLERVHRCFFVPDVALANLKRSPKAWRNLLVNLGVSLRASWREKPDVILSAGAGAALPSLLLGWLLGKRTVFLETLAHVRTPSVTGRIAARFVAVHLVQWEPLANLFPDAVVVCPLVSAKESLPPLSGAIRKTLVTVGTHAPFDRLVREVERLVEKGHIEGTVTAQVGRGGYRPPSMETFEECGQAEMQNLLEDSDLVITHAGTGSILAALEAGCRVLAVARSAAAGEHYDDHQLEILDELVRRKAILGAKDPSLLEDLIGQIPFFESERVRYDTEPIEREILRLLDRWSAGEPRGKPS